MVSQDDESRTNADIKLKRTFVASELIADKYKPKKTSEIVGDRSNVENLRIWLSSWNFNNAGKAVTTTFKRKFEMSDNGSTFKAVLLSGPPGIGKTTAATLVCNEVGYTYRELNASDVRSKKTLLDDIGSLLDNKTLTDYFGTQQAKTLNLKHALIMDEIDGMSGNEDRGGVAQVIQMIKKSKIPIILICNDRFSPKIRSLTKHCYDLRFSKPRTDQIKTVVRSICFNEEIDISMASLEEIISSSHHDIRQIFHYLSMAYFNTKSPSNKDIKLGPFDALRKLFSCAESENMTIDDKADLFFSNYGLMPLMVYENYLKTKPIVIVTDIERMKQIARSADAMAFSDVIEKHIRTNMNWSMLGLQAVYSTVMPATYMNSSSVSSPLFPIFLGRLSNLQKRERLLQELKAHMGLRVSGSKLALFMDYLGPLRDAIIELLGNGNVDAASALLQSYDLRKTDYESILELAQYRDSEDPYAGVKPATKAAFTRKMNKMDGRLPYADQKNVKLEGGSTLDDDSAFGSGHLCESLTLAEQQTEHDDSSVQANVPKKKKAKKTKLTASQVKLHVKPHNKQTLRK